MYEFKKKCQCGNILRATDGIIYYKYECHCGQVYTGTKNLFRMKMVSLLGYPSRLLFRFKRWKRRRGNFDY